MAKRARHFWSQLNYWILILGSLRLLPAPVFAMQPNVSFREVTQTADLIFIGTVEKTQSYIPETNNIILTDVTFSDLQVVWEGPKVNKAATNSVTLTFAGGQVGDLTLSVSDFPQFLVGQRVLLFSLYDGKRYFNPLIGGPQGLFRIVRDQSNRNEYALTNEYGTITGFRNGHLELGSCVDFIENGKASQKVSKAQQWTAPDPVILDGSGHQIGIARKTQKKTSPPLTLNQFLKEIQRLREGPREENPVLARILNPSNDDPQLLAKQGKIPTSSLLDRYLKGSVPQTEPSEVQFMPPGSTSDQAKTGGQGIIHCGTFELPIVMEQVPSSFWSFNENETGMLTYNRYMDIYRWRSDDGSYGINFYSEFCGFLTNSQIDDVYWTSWGTALAMCMCYAINPYWQCDELVEADIFFNANIQWVTDIDDSLGNYNNYLYRTALLHEMGHSWGMQRPIEEEYNYDLPTVMQGANSSVVEDGIGIHAIDCFYLRGAYEAQTPIIPYKDLGIESYYANLGLKKALTDKWNEDSDFGGIYATGETITLSDITVENMSSEDTASVDVYFYLSKTPNGKSYPFSETQHWSNFPKETLWTGSVTLTIPDNVPTGNDYYITLEVIGNSDPSWDNGPGNNVTYLTNTISVTCPGISQPLNLTASQGSWPGQIDIDFDPVSEAAYYEVWRGETANSGQADKIMPNLVTTHWADSDLNLVPSKSYYYWLKSVNPCLNTSSFSVAAVGFTSLTSPVATASDQDYGTHIEVTWPAASGATHYRVWMSDVYDVSSATPVGSWQTGRVYQDTQATPLTYYYYWVQAAVDASGTHASELVEAYVGVGRRGVPAPTGLVASDDDVNNPDAVLVQWNPVPGANYYRVWRGKSDDRTHAVNTAWFTETEYLDTIGPPGPILYYWVQSCTNDQGLHASEWAGPDQGSRPAPPLPSPVGVSATDGTSTDSVTISWDPVFSATHYRVWRGSTIFPFLSAPISDWIPDTSYEHTTGSPGYVYYYFVTAATDQDGRAESEHSFYDTGWRALPPVDGLNATDCQRSDGIGISWNDVFGASHYRVYRSATSDPLDAVLLVDWQAETSYLDTQTDPFTTYYYWVASAVNSGGSKASDWNPIPEEGSRSLPAPVNLQASDGTYGDHIQLTWDPVPGATYYLVYANGVDDFDTASWSISPTTETTDSKFGPSGTDMYFWVRCVSGNWMGLPSESDTGWQSWSPPTNVTASGNLPHWITVSWDAVPETGYYKVYRCETNSPQDAVPVSSWIDLTYFHDDSAAPLTPYYYWISTTPDPAGERKSPFSSHAIGLRTLLPPDYLEASKGVYQAFISLTWSESEGATHYRVWKSDTGDAHTYSACTDWLASLEYNDTNIVPGHVYYYQVQSASSDLGSWESPLSTNDQGWGRLPTPSNLIASDGQFMDKVEVQWDPVPEATFYQVYRSKTPVAIQGTPISDWQAETSFLDYPANEQTPYYYWVKAAVDGLGKSESWYGAYDLGWMGSDCTGDKPAPSGISGVNSVCSDTTGVVFATEKVSDAISYTWSVPADAQIVSGQGTPTIVVDMGVLSGEISVTADYVCGSSLPKTKTVLVTLIPDQPGPISGNATFCENQTGVAYSILDVSGATGYQWSVPSGAQVQSGQGTVSVIVDFGSVSGTVSVEAYNVCGTSQVKDLPVTVMTTPEQPSAISGPSQVCFHESNIVYSVPEIVNANSYNWTVPDGATIVQGLNTSEIQVDFGTTSGSVSVTAQNDCGISTESSLPVVVAEPVQIVKQPISQSLCIGANAQFQVQVQGESPISFQWHKDGSPLVGETESTLVLTNLVQEDEGNYYCSVENACATEESEWVYLAMDAPMRVWITPTSKALGLHPLSFHSNHECIEDQYIQLDWNTVPYTPFTVDGDSTLTFQSPPTENTQIQVTMTDTRTEDWVESHAHLLVAAHPVFMDFNQDGFNTCEDLWDLCVEWNRPYAGDPNDDGRLNVLDLLFINLDDN